MMDPIAAMKSMAAEVAKEVAEALIWAAGASRRLDHPWACR